MPLRYVKWISRADVQKNPESFFVFGDNAQRVGMGGQAGSMRGEPNSIGVATKWAPGRNKVDYFSDGDPSVLPAALSIIDADLKKVSDQLFLGKLIYVPSDGLGTGLSELPTRAPRLYAYMHRWFVEKSEKYEPCPWPSYSFEPEQKSAIS
jgi:hypothetical protein